MNSSRQNIQILIVEDETILAMNLQDRLADLGYEIAGCVGTGETAIESACAEKPDLVLMDIRLKGNMDGIEAANRIWEQCGIPVIIMSAYSDKSTADRVRESRSFGYLVKPIRSDDLSQAILSAMSKFATGMSPV